MFKTISLVFSCSFIQDIDPPDVTCRGHHGIPEPILLRPQPGVFHAASASAAEPISFPCQQHGPLQDGAYDAGPDRGL